jgi:acyl-CoA hydrolase
VNYDRQYNDLLRTAEEAVGLIEPGDDIIAGMAAGEPQALLEAMGGHSGFNDNRLYVMLPTHELPVDVDREKGCSRRRSPRTPSIFTRRV